MPSASDADPKLLDILASLNQIGAAINRMGAEESFDALPTLRLIVESAIKIIPDASAVLYTYDAEQHAFDPDSRVSAAERGEGGVEGDVPRPNGIGMRAIRQQRRVLSYEEPDLEIHPVMSQIGARAVACFPLIVAEQPVGALYVYLHDERSFSQSEQLMLDNLVNQAAAALYQVRRMAGIRRDLARKDDELKQLRRAGLLISSRLRLEETLEAILQMALEVTDARYGIFRLLDRGGRYLVMRAIAGDGLDRPLIEALPLDARSVMGWAAFYRQPVCIRDLREAPWNQIYYPLDAELEMRSELAVPLIGAGGRLEGVLNLESPQVGGFSAQDSRLLQSLAAQAVIAIQEVRLLDAMQEAAQRLITQPCPQVLSRLVELACELLNASASMIWRLRDGKLDLQAASGCEVKAAGMGLETSLEGRAVLRHEILEEGELSAALACGSPDFLGSKPTYGMVIPLMGSGEAESLGAFSIYSAAPDAARASESEWDKKVLTCLANYAVLAIQNAAHQDALRTAQEQRAVAETFAVVGDIAANLLHQLNNKVGTIPVRIQGIQDKCEALLAADRYLANNLTEIERSANQAMEAVRENLIYLRPIHLADVNVADCVAEAMEQANLPDAINVQVQALEALPPVRANQRSLALVFINLLENAADAMHSSGTITIRGARRSAWVELLVSDSGPGIPADLHERIFELNYSGRALQRPSKLGFGLWWVKTLTVRLGGAISVESDGHNGTTFRLRLPAVSEGQHA